MTDRDDTPTERDNGRPRTIVVPGTPIASEAPADDDILIDDVQQSRDLGSASRSCVAILAVLLIMALLICVFLVWALVLR